MIFPNPTQAALAFALLLPLACVPDSGERPAPSAMHSLVEAATPLPFELVREIDTGDFPAPSGVTYHPLRGTLFVVNDDGHVGEFRTDGTLVQRKHLIHDDFEAITCHPQSGLLYIAIEGRDDVLEVDPEGLLIRREYDLSRIFEGRKLFERGGQGIEGLAFVPNPDHPEGGTFFAANRSAHPKDLDDPPLILEFELPLSSTSTGELESKIVRYKRLQITELSGLHYDASNARLYALSDKNNLLIELTLDGEVLEVHRVPADDPEGITVDADGTLYIAQDSGGILKLRPAGAAVDGDAR